MIFIIKNFKTFVFIFIVISTTFTLCVFFGSSKGRSSKFRESSRVRQPPEEGQRTYWLKRSRNNNKDEEKSPKILNDKKKYIVISKFEPQ